MLDFSNAVEQQSNFKFVSTGIHDFRVDKIFYQPVGESVNNETKKDNSLINFSLEQIRIVLTCTKTHEGKDSKDASITISILPPVMDDPEKAQKQVNRMLHILCNIGSSSTKEKVTEYLKKIKVNSLREFAAKLNIFVGKSVRYKIIANQEGTYAQLPNYYSGFAECSDVAIENSILKYDEFQEGLKKKDSSKVEKLPTEDSNHVIDLFSSESNTNTSDISDDLPF